MPSFNLYRGALLAMLIGTALAVFLIMRPAGETKGASPVFVGRSTPTAMSEGDDEPTIAPATPEGTSTPAESPTPESTPAPTESPFNEYIVQEGDTLFSIAETQLPPGDDVAAFAQAIATLNGIDIDDPIINPGQTLLLPKPPSQ